MKGARTMNKRQYCESRESIAYYSGLNGLEIKGIEYGDNDCVYCVSGAWGGSALVYDGDIAAALCTPSELKRTRNGDRRPNSREEWLDVQARALRQAFRRMYAAIRAARQEVQA